MTSQNGLVAQPTTQLNATEQDTLVKQIGLALLRAAPRDWRRVTANYRAVGRYHELTGEVQLEDGSTQEWMATHDIASLFGRLRGGMYREGRGTWFNARYQLDHPSSYNLEYDREEPRWDLMPPPQAYADELRMFPRSEDNVPEWLMRRMAGLAPEQPGPRFRIARIFDGHEPSGRPVLDRPDLDADEQHKILEYLNSAPVVRTERGFDLDRLAQQPAATVPVAFHTDGVWIWPAAVNYYLQEYGVAPEAELVAHISGTGYTLPEVPEQALQGAAAYLTRGTPPRPPRAVPEQPRPEPEQPVEPTHGEPLRADVEQPTTLTPVVPPDAGPPTMLVAPAVQEPSGWNADEVDPGTETQLWHPGEPAGDERDRAGTEQPAAYTGAEGAEPEPRGRRSAESTAYTEPETGRRAVEGAAFAEPGHPGTDNTGLTEPETTRRATDGTPYAEEPRGRRAQPEPGHPGTDNTGLTEPETTRRATDGTPYAEEPRGRRAQPEPEGRRAFHEPEGGREPDAEARFGQEGLEQRGRRALADEDARGARPFAGEGGRRSRPDESPEARGIEALPGQEDPAVTEPRSSWHRDAHEQHWHEDSRGGQEPPRRPDAGGFTEQATPQGGDARGFGGQDAAHATAFAEQEPPRGPDYTEQEPPHADPAFTAQEPPGPYTGQDTRAAFGEQEPPRSPDATRATAFTTQEPPGTYTEQDTRPAHGEPEPHPADNHAHTEPEPQRGTDTRAAFAAERGFDDRGPEARTAAPRPGFEQRPRGGTFAGPEQARRPEQRPAPDVAQPTMLSRPVAPPPLGEPVLDNLRSKLVDLGVPDEAFRIGEPAEHGWSLEKVDDGWRVGWYDDTLTSPAVFGDADDAAAFMLGKLMLNPGGRETPPGRPEMNATDVPARQRETAPEPQRHDVPPHTLSDRLDEPEGPPTMLAATPPVPPPPARREPPPRRVEPATTSSSGGSGQQWPIQPLQGEPPLTLFRGKEMRELPAGSELDRFGGPSGNLTYAAGTPFEERSLVPEWVSRPYHVYRVQRPIEALAGVAIPWFNQPGGGAAYLLPASIEELLASGDLIELDPGEPPID